MTDLEFLIADAPRQIREAMAGYGFTLDDVEDFRLEELEGVLYLVLIADGMAFRLGDCPVIH